MALKIVIGIVAAALVVGGVWFLRSAPTVEAPEAPVAPPPFTPQPVEVPTPPPAETPPPPATKTPKPSITVLSPNGGERWIIGTTHDITWSGGQNPLVILLEGPEYGDPAELLFKGGIATNVDPRQGRFTWRVGDLFDIKFETKSTAYPGDKYVVRISDFTLGDLDRSDGPFTIEAQKTSETPPPAPQTVTVTYGPPFVPASVMIKAGDTVKFVNQSSGGMWVASNPHPIHTDLSGFDAFRSVPPGESYSYTFTQKGTWRYHNHVNPGQGGTVIVE